MSNQKYSQLSVLVVDDFPSFRTTMNSMLNKLGVKKIEEAVNAQQAIKWCKEREFDFILCDYNLGGSRNGQHILEELRHRNLIQYSTLFVMVTAESSKAVVLSAYDCEPDDYLTKPINLQVLEQRLGRLVQQRDTLISVYRLMENDQTDRAISELEKIIKQPGRHAVIAQKLLGQLYLNEWRLDDAEELYETNLQKRHLDWAMLGVGKVAMARGDFDKAKEHLEALIKHSRLFLPAYDSLATVYEKEGDFDAMLGCMQDVVLLSPRSLLRQRKLATVAMDYGEVKKALDASLEIMKLSEASCHKSSSDALTFLNAAGNALESGLEYGNIDLLEESKKCLSKLTADNSLNSAEQVRASLMTARVQALSGDEVNAKHLAEETRRKMGDSDRQNLDVGLAEYSYLVSVDDLAAADALANDIIAQHGEEAEHTYKLDKLLSDPKDEVNRQRVAQLNKAGIDAHKSGRHEEALVLFRRALLLFPRHVGLHLNCLQTMVAQLRQEPGDSALRNKVRDQIEKLSMFISDDTHPQHARFQQLIASMDSLNKR